MTFPIAIVLLCAAGLSILGLLRLRSASAVVDLAIAWFVGTGWFGMAMAATRFIAHVPYTTATAIAVVLAPVAVSFTRRSRDAAGRGGVADRVRPRWLPRPAWAFAPLAAYVAVVVIAVVLHGFATPTQTDDGVRVRAFTPVLAFEDQWPSRARALLAIAGSIPTFAPSLAWRIAGGVDLFHVNYFVLTTLFAFLVLAIGVASLRGCPERGWASAFGVLSLPLFVYHCTSTYMDAVLAMYVGAGFLFAIEYAASSDVRDALRAVLVLTFATMVKREGWLVAGAAAAVVFAQIAWNRRRGRVVPLPVLALLCTPFVLDVAARVAAVGATQALPFLGVLASRAADTSAGVASPSASSPALAAHTVWRAFGYAVFQSGNAGFLFWLLPATCLMRIRAVVHPAFAWPLATVALLLTEATASSVWLVPTFTLDQSTVHRALIPVSVVAVLWLAALVVHVPQRGDGEESSGAAAR